MKKILFLMVIMLLGSLTAEARIYIRIDEVAEKAETL